MDSSPYPSVSSPSPFVCLLSTPPVKSTIICCLSPDGSFDSGKYMQYATAHTSHTWWHILMAMINTPSHGEFHDTAAQAVNWATPVKTHAKKGVLACKGTEDGLIEVITPKELSWYWYYVVIFLL
jgi:hypothetical protein